MRVLVFGDSISQGFWDKKGGWTHRLKTHFQDEYFDGRNQDPPTIFNLGVSGDTSQDLLDRIEPEIVARNKYGEIAIVIAIGGNDARIDGGVNYSNTDIYRSNLEKLLAIARQYATKIMFIGLTSCEESRSNPVAWDNVSYLNTRIKEFNEELRLFCADNKMTFVDVLPSFIEKQLEQDMLPDGIHPNDAGHQLIFDKILPELDALIGVEK